MLTESEIAQLIQNDRNSEKKRLAAIGQRYYDADHDILKARLFYYDSDGCLQEDTTRSNIKICHPFFTEISDQLAAYMLSFTENPIRARKTAEGLQEQLDIYFDDEFWSEISELITGTNNKGFEYLYGYQNEDDRIAFQCADSLGVVEVRARDTDDKCEYIIYWYLDRIEYGHKTITRIQVWDKKQIAFFVQENGGRVEKDTSVAINPRPHIVFRDKQTGQMMGQSLGYIPFWRLDNNRKRVSGLKPIKALIDDYDLMECGLSNNLADFDTPLHVVTGYEGTDLAELQQNLKTKKIVGLGEGGGVTVQTVDIPYEARKVKADEDEKNIYRFGFGFNSAQSGDGNITNVVIRSRYTLLDLKANKLEMRLRRLLKDLLRVVLDEINDKNGTNYQLKDIYFEFTREILTNEQENIANEKTKAETRQIEVNTILNMAASIGDEQALKAICDIMEFDYDEIKSNMPEDAGAAAEAAQKALNDILAESVDDE